ncbi:MAG: hypothetical protein Q7J57_08685, partial [Gemmobacter sp.]|nr:hypothetical protein [Gemmobacter sp.]
IEVQVRLQKSLLGLVLQAPARFGPPATRLSRRALALAKPRLPLEEDRIRIATLSDEVAAHARITPVPD